MAFTDSSGVAASALIDLLAAFVAVEIAREASWARCAPTREEMEAIEALMDEEGDEEFTREWVSAEMGCKPSELIRLA
jgi:hypothetical protein